MKSFCTCIIRLGLGVGLCAFLGGAVPGNAEEPPLLRLNPRGHTASVNGLLFTDAGKRLLSVGEDGVVRVWNLDNHRLEHAWRWAASPTGGKYSCAALSSASPPLLAIGESSEKGKRADVLLVDPSSGLVIKRLSTHTTKVTGVAFRADGKQLAACDEDGRICVYDTQDMNAWSCRELDPADPADKHPCYCLTYSPDGKLLAAGKFNQGGEVQIWDAYTLQKPRRKKMSSYQLTNLAWSTQGILAASDAQGEGSHIILWKPDEQDEQSNIIELEQQKTQTDCLAFSPDGRWLLTGLDGANGLPGVVRTWNVATRKPYGTVFAEHHLPIASVAFAANQTPDGGYRVASGDDAGGIYVWDFLTHKVELNPGSRQPIFRIAWSHDGSGIVWSHSQEAGTPYDCAFDLLSANPVPVKDIKLFDEAAGGDTKRRLYIKSDQLGVELWDPNKKITDFPLEVVCHAATLTQEDQALIATGQNVKCYDVSAKARAAYKPVTPNSAQKEVSLELPGKPDRTFTGNQGLILGLSVSPNGRYLAGVSSDQTVLIWSLKDEGSGPNREVHPLITVYVGSNEEWVAWNDQTGYYADGPSGDDLFGFQINTDPSRSADFHPAYQCQNLFYKPEMLRQIFKEGRITSPPPQGSLEKLIQKVPEIAAAAVQVEAGEASNTKPLQPVEGIFDTDQAEVTISVPVKRTTDFTVQMNSQILSKGVEDVTDATVQALKMHPDLLVKRIRLTSGMNSINIVAKNQYGTDRLSLKIRCNTPHSSRSDLHLLAVGAGKFDQPGITLNPLPFARNDAAEILRVFNGQRGVAFSDVIAKPLLDAQATRQAIFKELDHIVEATQQTPEDRVLLYFSGHGFEDKRTGKYYFVPSDVRQQNHILNVDTAVAWEDVFKKVLAMKAKYKIVIIDDCYASGAGTNLPQAQEEANTERRLDDSAVRQAREDGIIVFTSSTKKQISLGNKQQNQSIFTGALVKILENRASGLLISKNGEITLKSASDAMNTAMHDELKRLGYPDIEQHSSLYAQAGGIENEIVLAKLISSP